MDLPLAETAIAAWPVAQRRCSSAPGKAFLGDGVTVAQQILVLLVLVRIQIPQFWPEAEIEQEKLEQVSPDWSARAVSGFRLPASTGNKKGLGRKCGCRRSVKVPPAVYCSTVYGSGRFG